MWPAGDDFGTGAQAAPQRTVGIRRAPALRWPPLTMLLIVAPCPEAERSQREGGRDRESRQSHRLGRPSCSDPFASRDFPAQCSKAIKLIPAPRRNPVSCLRHCLAQHGKRSAHTRVGVANTRRNHQRAARSSVLRRRPADIGPCRHHAQRHQHRADGTVPGSMAHGTVFRSVAPGDVTAEGVADARQPQDAPQQGRSACSSENAGGMRQRRRLARMTTNGFAEFW